MGKDGGEWSGRVEEVVVAVVVVVTANTRTHSHPHPHTHTPHHASRQTDTRDAPPRSLLPHPPSYVQTIGSDAEVNIMKNRESWSAEI